jgi:hypothetical protein
MCLKASGLRHETIMLLLLCKTYRMRKRDKYKMSLFCWIPHVHVKLDIKADSVLQNLTYLTKGRLSKSHLNIVLFWNQGMWTDEKMRPSHHKYNYFTYLRESRLHSLCELKINLPYSRLFNVTDLEKKNMKFVCYSLIFWVILKSFGNCCVT